MSLINAVQQMSAAATAQRVGLVIRFNQDDTAITTLWSESPNSLADQANPPNGSRSPMLRPQNDDLPNGATRAIPPSCDVAGYHAEEILISAWDAVLAAAQVNGPLRMVEMVLSKSPCHGPGGSSPLKVGINGPMMPQGCAGKLATFIRAKNQVHPQVAWRVFFLSLAGSAGDSYQRVGVGVRAHMTAEDIQLSNASRAQVAYRDSQQRALQTQIGHLHGQVSQLHQQAMGIAKQLTAQGESYGRQIGVHAKGMKSHASKARQAVQRDQQRMGELMNGARHMSVRQAQAGIVQLEMIRNVDCRRWTGAV